MDRKELARKIYDISHITGEFKLRSGQVSSEYFDKYRFEAQPELLRSIGQQLKALVPADTEVLAGLEMGGIPIAVAVSFETGIPVVFVRKEAKEYGTRQFAEGLDVKGKKVTIIEDVITTGGQVVLSTKDLRRLGAEVENVLCVINRGERSNKNLTETSLTLQSLFTKDDFTF